MSTNTIIIYYCVCYLKQQNGVRFAWMTHSLRETPNPFIIISLKWNSATQTVCVRVSTLTIACEIDESPSAWTGWIVMWKKFFVCRAYSCVILLIASDTVGSVAFDRTNWIEFTALCRKCFWSKVIQTRRHSASSNSINWEVRIASQTQTYLQWIWRGSQLTKHVWCHAHDSCRIGTLTQSRSVFNKCRSSHTLCIMMMSGIIASYLWMRVCVPLMSSCEVWWTDGKD